ncbi:MAG TPA: PAS domain S-box protein, partial [Blastocatellia bacterium]|nr:PAS domain S-box protein [Blastocatellia bacterium]
DSETGLALVRRAMPDLVIANAMMRAAGGIELCREVKRGPTTAEIPVLLATSMGHSAESVSALTQGADDYFEIGGPVEILLRKVQRFVSLRKERAGREAAEEALRFSVEQYRLLFEANPIPMWVYDCETLRFLAVNSAAQVQYGYTNDEFLELTIRELRPPDDVADLLEALDSSALGLVTGRLVRHRRRDGAIIWVELSSHDIMFQKRGARLVSASDVTERTTALVALRASEERFSKTFRLNPDPMSIQGFDDERYIDVNESFLKVYGFTREEVVARTPDELNMIVDAGSHAEWRRVLLSGETIYDREVQFRVKSGDVRTGLFSAVSTEVADSKCVLAVITDVTERKRLQEQLLQAQRMEAIGTLAGGIAHDFNNLLTVVVGYSQILKRKLREGDPARKQVDEIEKAGARATSLTRQLLAFSRKQVFELRVLNLNRIVEEMEPMLHRLISEDIELVAHLDPELGSVKADSAQIEQVILNLVVNARDAMEGGGILTIETRNVDVGASYLMTHAEAETGRFALLAVSDTGHGIDKQTQARVFEPFFTTKPKGKGTGLGLATSHGIVKQSGGNILVYSELGHGTVFKVYLPRVDDPPDAEIEYSTTERAVGSETLLLVEDEDLVRNLAKDILAAAGYTVLEARDGVEALAISAQYAGTIHLLLTDAVMPQISGLELAGRLSTARDGIGILFMSGYTSEGLLKGISATYSSLLQKPFTPDQLLRKVRDVLDQKGHPAGETSR